MHEGPYDQEADVHSWKVEPHHIEGAARAEKQRLALEAGEEDPVLLEKFWLAISGAGVVWVRRMHNEGRRCLRA